MADLGPYPSPYSQLLVPTQPRPQHPPPRPTCLEASLNPRPFPHLRIHCFCLGIHQNPGQRRVGSPDVFSLPSWVPRGLEDCLRTVDRGQWGELR